MNSKQKLDKIDKMATEFHKERYDTDWDTMQETLYKIWEICNK